MHFLTRVVGYLTAWLGVQNGETWAGALEVKKDPPLMEREEVGLEFCTETERWAVRLLGMGPPYIDPLKHSSIDGDCEQWTHILSVARMFSKQACD